MIVKRKRYSIFQLEGLHIRWALLPDPNDDSNYLEVRIHGDSRKFVQRKSSVVGDYRRLGFDRVI